MCPRNYAGDDDFFSNKSEVWWFTLQQVSATYNDISEHRILATHKVGESVARVSHPPRQQEHLATSARTLT